MSLTKARGRRTRARRQASRRARTSNASDSMSSARERLIPCDLCTVSAHASRSGIAIRTTAPPGPPWKKEVGSTVRRWPVSKVTIAHM